MAYFYYDSTSPDSYISQWNKFLQQRSFFDEQGANIGNFIARQTSDFQATLLSVSREQEIVMQESIGIVSNTIESGVNLLLAGIDQGCEKISLRLENVTQELSGINYELRRFIALFDRHMSMLLEEQRLSNMLSANIALLLRIPDMQKERQYYIEQGVKFFCNGRLDEELFYDALENLLKAESIEKTDYFVLHRIGLIYLYGGSCVDLSLAEDYFRRAGKYAAVESDPQAARVINLLACDVHSDLGSQQLSIQNIKKVAADSYFHAALACYAQAKFTDAATLAEKSFSLDEQMLGARFFQAKALSAGGREQEAIPILEQVIKKDRTYAIKAAIDVDLGSKVVTKTLLAMLRDEAISVAKNKVRLARSQGMAHSEVRPVLDSVEQLAVSGTYLGALAAIDEFTRSREFSYQKVIAEKVTTSLLSIVGKKEISRLSVNQKQGFLVMEGYNNVLGILDYNTLNEISPFSFSGKATHIVFSPDGRYLCYRHGSDRINVGKLQTGGGPDRWSKELGYFQQYIFSQDGETIALAGGNKIAFWEFGSKRQNILMNDGCYNVECMTFSPDGRFFAFGGFERVNENTDYHVRQKEIGCIHVYDIAAKEWVNYFRDEYRKSDCRIIGLTFSSDSQRLISLDYYTGEVRIRNIRERSVIRKIPERSLKKKRSGLHNIILSPDGNLLAIVSGFRIRLWDLEQDREVDSIEIDDKPGKSNMVYPITSVIFTPDGEALLVADYSDEIKRLEICWGVGRGVVKLNTESFIPFERAQFQKISTLEMHNKAKTEKRIMNESGQKQKLEELGKQKKKQQQQLADLQLAESYFLAGMAEEQRQNKRWFFKNYKDSLVLYRKALDLGLEMARAKVLSLEKKYEK